jgi:hypothetical protein
MNVKRLHSSLSTVPPVTPESVAQLSLAQFARHLQLVEPLQNRIVAGRREKSCFRSGRVADRLGTERKKQMTFEVEVGRSVVGRLDAFVRPGVGIWGRDLVEAYDWNVEAGVRYMFASF